MFRSDGPVTDTEIIIETAASVQSRVSPCPACLTTLSLSLPAHLSVSICLSACLPVWFFFCLYFLYSHWRMQRKHNLKFLQPLPCHPVEMNHTLHDTWLYIIFLFFCVCFECFISPSAAPLPSLVSHPQTLTSRLFDLHYSCQPPFNLCVSLKVSRKP